MRLGAFLAVVALPSPALAQQAGLPKLTAEQMIARSKTQFNAGTTSQPCGRSLRMDEIIVCGLGKDALRLKPIEPITNEAVKALNLRKGGPHGAVGASVTMAVCFLQKCPPPIFFIDVKSLPEAPAGSDADKIARGEMSDH